MKPKRHRITRNQLGRYRVEEYVAVNCGTGGIEWQWSPIIDANFPTLDEARYKITVLRQAATHEAQANTWEVVE